MPKYNNVNTEKLQILTENPQNQGSICLKI